MKTAGRVIASLIVVGLAVVTSTSFLRPKITMPPVEQQGAEECRDRCFKKSDNCFGKCDVNDDNCRHACSEDREECLKDCKAAAE